jgi:hypothetical protein
MISADIPRSSEHLNVLESDLADRNSLIKASQDEIRRLRDENDERESRIEEEVAFKAHFNLIISTMIVRRRLSKYEHIG